MPASRTDISIFPSSLVVEATGTRIQIPQEAVRLHRHGVEFTSPRPFELWTEMTVALDDPTRQRRIQGTGVVVASEGDRHRGYTVSILFLDLAASTPINPWQINRADLS